MEYQIRSYWVKPGLMDQFLQVWRTGVVPLRRSAGFKVVGAWLSRDENRFTWMVSWDGPGTIEEATKSYQESPGRKALAPDPSTLLAKTDIVNMAAVRFD